MHQWCPVPTEHKYAFQLSGMLSADAIALLILSLSGKIIDPAAVRSSRFRLRMYGSSSAKVLTDGSINACIEGDDPEGAPMRELKLITPPAWVWALGFKICHSWSRVRNPVSSSEAGKNMACSACTVPPDPGGSKPDGD